MPHVCQGLASSSTIYIHGHNNSSIHPPTQPSIGSGWTSGAPPQAKCSSSSISTTAICRHHTCSSWTVSEDREGGGGREGRGQSRDAFTFALESRPYLHHTPTHSGQLWGNQTTACCSRITRRAMPHHVIQCSVQSGTVVWVDETEGQSEAQYQASHAAMCRPLFLY
jgi:hypothetical protein